MSPTIPGNVPRPQEYAHSSAAVRAHVFADGRMRARSGEHAKSRQAVTVAEVSVK